MFACDGPLRAYMVIRYFGSIDLCVSKLLRLQYCELPFSPQICLKVKNEGWEEVFAPQVEAPYAHGGNQWVGYDNKKSIEIKVSTTFDGHARNITF